MNKSNFIWVESTTWMCMKFEFNNNILYTNLFIFIKIFSKINFKIAIFNFFFYGWLY